MRSDRSREAVSLVIAGIMCAFAIALCIHYYKEIYTPYQLIQKEYLDAPQACPRVQKLIDEATIFGIIPYGDGVRALKAGILAHNKDQHKVLRRYKRKLQHMKSIELPKQQYKEAMQRFRIDLKRDLDASCDMYAIAN